MRISYPKLIVLGLLAITATSANAQTGIETLVVTGKRVAEQPIAGAQSLAVAAQQPGNRADAAELLQGLNGVQADSRSNFAQDTRITLRGFGARSAFGVRGVDLQVDGIPLTMPDGQGQFSGAVLDGVTQVNVLTGPVAALYGNAAGGVINLQASAPTADKISLSTGGDEEGLVRHKLLAEIKDGDFGFRMQTTKLNADGNRPHASAERTQVGAQAYYEFDNHLQAQWRFDKEDAPLLQDPLGLSEAQWRADPNQINSGAEFFNTRKTISHEQQAISLRQEKGEQRWQLALWQGNRAVGQYLALKGDAPGSSGGVVDLQRSFNGGNGNYTWDLNQTLSFTLGGEWSRMEDNRKGYVNNAGRAGDLRRDENDTAENRDLYGIMQWQATDHWQWLFGARHSQLQFSVQDFYVVPGKNANDSGEKNFSSNSESLATRYEITPHFSVHAALGNGFETPTLTEMAYTNGDAGFNRSLDAAQNHQQEVGVDFQRDELKLSLVAFGVQSKNELVVDRSVNGRTTYRNAAGTDRKGLEFSGDYRVNSQWNARFAFNYLDATYTKGQFESLQMPGIAKHNQYAQVNFRPFENDLLTLGLSANHRSEVAPNDDNTFFAPAYTVVDLAVSGKLNLAGLQTRWWIKESNIPDKKYAGSVIVNQSNGRAFEPAGGRNLAAGVELEVPFK